MKIHEYQAKEILRSFGVPVPESKIAFSVKEAEEAAAEIGLPVVVKAQIHAGGRGKGGGVKFAPTAQDVSQYANDILGMTLVTHQTGPEGKLVKKVLIEAASNIDRELYAGIVMDRATSAVTFMVSTEGGMEIEKVAEETPEKIVKVVVDTAVGLQPFQARQMAFALNLTGDAFKNGVKFLMALYKAYMGTDASIFEINPLVVTKEGAVIALDAKANFDENALYRHKDIVALRDLDEEEPLEIEAGRSGLNYIKLEGNIGCMVNGAGLAMGTMDIIKLTGGEPANFLDVGGGASAETVEKGFRIILSDKNVKAVLINIFGGIVRCDRVAKGVIEAIKNIDTKVPIVVRLQGTNAEEGKKLLEESGMNIIAATELKDAAEKVVGTLKTIEA
ncbi:ADP-forming succinate--CoA ligase subunit beta [Marinifilum breve]|jgi:succinyl-CoA synthetase (ADP-forming) beta subunit (EC 6.2.1.5)|uniref:Succinate--CoA ligase [ADP-forming] subunit beta n=1 Tax=Marinifilum breve TaxID=2184082 RepID=A0A2V3ZXI5_9BACT|nr:ADP-forming succinate--CoA ligase subunit beta [Marinifilum breve]PXX97843.1 ADP-forming succinate--CoA ligase subunit beta [Marinifilum breve]